MATNGTTIESLQEEAARHGLRAFDNRLPNGGYVRSAEPAEPARELALAPLVDKIAYGIARGLVVAMKELEDHIASETRKVGDSVDRRLDVLQASLQDLSNFMGEQRSTNAAVQSQLEKLATGLQETEARQTAGMDLLRKEAQESAESLSQRIVASTAALQEADNRQTAELVALQNETRALSQTVSGRIDDLCKELGVQQEDLAAAKATLCTFSARVDAIAERLDRQADAVRSMHAAYSQRESELGQIVDGLARLRAFSTPMPSNGL